MGGCCCCCARGGQVDTAATRLFTRRIEQGAFAAAPGSNQTRAAALGPAGDLGDGDLVTAASLATARALAANSLVLLRNAATASAASAAAAADDDAAPSPSSAPPLLPLPLAAADAGAAHRHRRAGSPPRVLGVVGPNANDTAVLAGNYYGCSAAGTTEPLIIDDPRCGPLLLFFFLRAAHRCQRHSQYPRESMGAAQQDASGQPNAPMLPQRATTATKCALFSAPSSPAPPCKQKLIFTHPLRRRRRRRSNDIQRTSIRPS